MEAKGVISLMKTLSVCPFWRKFLIWTCMSLFSPQRVSTRQVSEAPVHAFTPETPGRICQKTIKDLSNVGILGKRKKLNSG